MRVNGVVNFFAGACLSLATAAAANDGDNLQKCPGYKATNVKTTSSGLTADLHLAGPACNVYGKDLDNLKFLVDVEHSNRIHVKIYDAAEEVYQVPESVFPRPKSHHVDSKKANLQFDIKENPFSFKITRKSNKEVLFDSSAAGLVIEDQYLRLRTSLPKDTNLYGLGEHTDSFRFSTNGYRRTIFNADAGTPENENLYGSHPIYLEHRSSGSHGVFLLNSNGMDIFIDKDANGDQYLEYNTIGGVFDFYFLAGPSPIEVTKQYAEVAGLPVTIPYAGLGFHNCRWGYQDAYNLAEVIQNYSTAGIPLETMWADIDYMDGRSVFSVDPERFPMRMMREIVDHLHSRNQHFTVMVDPAVAARDYPPYHRGLESDVFILRDNGSVYNGVVWPGLTAYPDWFSENSTAYWNNEFANFFSPEKGIDIDFLWIDMNEPANFCDYPCNNPQEAAKGLPPKPPAIRLPPRPLPGWSCDFQPKGTDCKPSQSRSIDSTPHFEKRDEQVLSRFTSRHDVDSKHWKGLPNRELLEPPYKIHNVNGPLSQKTINTDLHHHNGLTQYDTHNLYGSLMSVASRDAMQARRPGKRPLIITRATFAGAGAHVSHWLGDNNSDWPHYQWTIREMLAFASIFQIPMVGSDVCGFGSDTTEELCARWAMLGAFQPFYRNHNAEAGIGQEFYRWKSVTAAAKKAIDIRYRLLDYIYTAMMQQSKDGTPTVYPMMYLYPHDSKTFDLDLQYFYGNGILVAPVTEQGADSVDIYLPDDVFYDFYTHQPYTTGGGTITKKDQGLTDIPLFYRGGVIVPLRVKSAMTTHDLRKQDFELVIPVGKNGKAEGWLYLDDGESLKPQGSWIHFKYSYGKLKATGQYGYKTDLKIVKVTLIAGSRTPGNSQPQSKSETVNQPLTGDFTINI